ncbi:MAG: hypothetical protein AB1673_01495 [Actinomycetota bacterium]
MRGALKFGNRRTDLEGVTSGAAASLGHPRRSLLPGNRLVAAFVLGLLAAVPVLSLRLIWADRLGQGIASAFTTVYAGRYVDNPLTTMVIMRDAQGYAALARDPSLARPEVFYDETHAAYRAQRPLLAYALWAMSLGQPRFIEPLLVLTALAGAGFLALAGARLLEDRGVDGRLGAVLVVTPGAVASLVGLVPETWAAGFALFGVRSWLRGRPGAAVALLMLATLTRETMLLVPAVLAWPALRNLGWRRALTLSVPFLAWGTWLAVVKARFGAWPWESPPSRLSAPLVGIVEAAPHMSDPAVMAGGALLAVALVVLCLRRLGDPLAPLALAFAVLGVLLAAPVWWRWEDIGRVLLPLYAFGALVLISPPPSPNGVQDAPGTARSVHQLGWLAKGGGGRRA